MVHDQKKANGQTTKAEQAKGKDNGQQISFDEAVAEGKGNRFGAQGRRGPPVAAWRTGRQVRAQIREGHDQKMGQEDRHSELYGGPVPARVARMQGNFGPGANFIPAPSYAVCRELAKHPDAAEIIRKNPEITKSEARERMQKYKEENEGKKNNKSSKGHADGFHKDNKRWCKTLVVQANAAIKLAAVMKKCTPEQGRRLAEAIEPHLVKTVEKAGEDWEALGAWLRELMFRKLIAEDRDNTSPKSPAAEPNQVSA